MDLRNVRLADPEPDEKIGRTVTNAFGQPELVVMEWRSWQYYDWLSRESRGMPIDEWVRECDLSRGNASLSEALEDWIFLEFRAREKDGKPRPPYLPQQGKLVPGDDE
jgi:hypothetical protein